MATFKSMYMCRSCKKIFSYGVVEAENVDMLVFPVGGGPEITIPHLCSIEQYGYAGFLGFVKEK